MAEPAVPDDVRERFAELTGDLEDAALIASRGQSIRTVVTARRCADRLDAALARVRSRLHRLRAGLE
jgi:hypothetical protein